MANTYTVKKTIKGTEYTAQFNGISAALNAVDNSYIDGTNNTSVEKISKYLLENVIVYPKLSISDFGAEKIGKTETKTINGVEYTAKFDGVLTALRAIDTSYIEGTDNTSTEKIAKYLFENIIVTPENLSIDDFDNMNDFNEVVAFAREVMQGGETMKEFNEITGFAREVMQGNFQEKKDKKPTKTTSKK